MDMKNNKKYLEGVSVRDLTEKDREKCEGLNFEYLLESKSKIFEKDNLYVIVGGADYESFGKEKLCNVIYKEKSKILSEDILKVDFEKIANDPEFNKPKIIEIEFMNNIEGTNETIFKAIGKEKYYMRQDDKEEKYAKWYSVFQSKGLWIDNAPIRANVTFKFKDNTENVTYSNWSGFGVNANNYNEKFSYDYLKNEMEDEIGD